MSPQVIRNWVYANWQYAGLCAAIFLVGIFPLLWNTWDRALLIVYFQLPLYMVHQVEEHAGDHFRVYINRELAGGRNALTHEAVLVINFGAVWLLDLAALYLAYFAHRGLGLIAMYLAIVNAVIHLLGVVAKRAYNPGAVTAAVLLLPGAFLGLWIFARDAQATREDHILALALAIVLHLAIVGWVGLRVRSLRQIPHTL